ncbi:unnamed protein product [Caenorhabditis auriculariae]|uniref:Dihydropteridine reductase n=1 Tax=Caenorhabditis auriculariae TaxID=2777116 RepID=A0A8S1HSH9_9PELO|nr:unnamed protein product [Caenorhabditis auriculariae]
MRSIKLLREYLRASQPSNFVFFNSGPQALGPSVIYGNVCMSYLAQNAIGSQFIAESNVPRKGDRLRREGRSRFHYFGTFQKKNDFWVLNIDLSTNDHADGNILVSGDSWTEQEKTITAEAEKHLSAASVDGIFCVAGGWAGGSASSKDFIKNAELMWSQSVWSSSIAAKLASLYLKPNGVLQLTGAAAATDGTPGMIGYGMAKAAVHQLTKSLGAKDSGLPEEASVLALLPVTLDTPMNRKWMPKADHSTWTPMSFIAETLHKWTTEPGCRPATGSLLKLTTADNETIIDPQ